ncbi:hypothetical protein [Paenibacillus sp. R14(2021)]|uniref:hypothetical protein n=1 Tax=Paenibacillus sp. R14(2021) TaxID=2859228 RepID=UPI001C614AE9|nr:hypothetical protein [Paenibacillus sp. R14(2021)]
MTATIFATFLESRHAREAQHKLQFLRVEHVDEGHDGISITAMVGEELMERAMHVIRQSGGTVEQ